MNLIKKAVYTGLLLALPIIAMAEEYYVSRAGNDAWSGTLSEPNEHFTDGPFKTIAHLNKIQFSTNDRISLRRGDVWHEPLLINDSGLTINAYGTGARPLLNMAERITGWELHRGSIYVADCNHEVVQVFVDDKRMQVAHHPNKGFLYADADASSTNSLVDNDLSQITESLVGAHIMLRARHWVWYGTNISAKNGSVLEFDANLPDKYLIKRNFGYILAHKLWMLDSPGEWYHDKAKGRLYVWLENSDDPNEHLMEVSRYENGILFDHVSNVTVENIAVEKSRETGVQLTRSTHTTLKGCLITKSGEFGILGGSGSEHQCITGNTIKDSILGGIVYSRSEISNIIIEENTITDTLTSLVLRPVNGYLFGWGSGIKISRGSNNVIQNNRVTNSGYSSMIIGGEDNKAERNILENSCLLLDDGGGIYIAGTGHVIAENIIRNAIGNSEGTPSFYKQPYYTRAQGIYPDDRSGRVQILNNTIINTNLGILLHNSTENTVKGNTVYGARSNGIMISEDDIVGIPGLVHDNRVEENILLTFSPKFAAMRLNGHLGHIDFGTYDNNYYAHPYSGLAVRMNLPSESRDFNLLRQWQEFSGFDVDSLDMANILTIRPYIVDSVADDTLVLNGSLDTDKSSWSKGWSPDNTIHTDWTSHGGLDGGCIKTYSVREEKSRGDILTSSSHFAVTEGVDYRIRFSLRANNTDMVKAVVRRTGAPDYSPVGFNKLLFVGPEPHDYEFVFKATATHGKSRIDFHSGLTAETTYYIDNVSLEPVNVRYTIPIEDIIVLVNEEETPRTIHLKDRTYLDIYGNEVSESIQLSPFRSTILINHNKYTDPLPEQEKEYTPNAQADNYTYTPPDTMSGDTVVDGSSSSSSNSRGCFISVLY